MDGKVVVLSFAPMACKARQRLVHKTSHGLRKIARRFAVKVAFSAPVQTGTTCAAVKKKFESINNKKTRRVWD